MGAGISTNTLTIQGLDNKVSLQDVRTRLGRDITVVGYLAATKFGDTENSASTGDGLTAIGVAAGAYTTGVYNTFLGAHAGESNTSGRDNTYVGAYTGLENDGEYNVFLGAKTGGSVTAGSRNVYLGAGTAGINNGNNNVFIGYNNTNTSGARNVSSSIMIGSTAYTYTNRDIGIGNGVVINGTDSLVIGHESKSLVRNSIVMGNYVQNYGSNSFILMTGQSASNVFVNNEDDVVNINNKLFLGGKSNSATFNYDRVYIGNSNNNIQISPSNLTLNALDLDAIVASNIRTQASNYFWQGSNWTMTGFQNVYMSACNFDLSGTSNLSALGLENIQLSTSCNVSIATCNLDLSGTSNLNALSLGNVNISACNLDFSGSSNLYAYGLCNIGLTAYTIDLTGTSNLYASGLCNISLDASNLQIGIGGDSSFSITSNAISLSNAYGYIDLGCNELSIFHTSNITLAASSGGGIAINGDAGDVNIYALCNLHAGTSNVYVDIQEDTGVLSLYAACNALLEAGSSFTIETSNNYFGMSPNNISLFKNVYDSNTGDVLGVNGYEIKDDGTWFYGPVNLEQIHVSSNSVFEGDVVIKGDLNFPGFGSLSNYILSFLSNNPIYFGCNVVFDGDVWMNGNEYNLPLSYSNMSVCNLDVTGDINFQNFGSLSNYLAAMLSNLGTGGGGGGIGSNFDWASLSNYVMDLVRSNQMIYLNTSNLYHDCPAFYDSNISTYEGSMIINNHLHVGGVICAGRMELGQLQINNDFQVVGDMSLNGTTTASNFVVTGSFTLSNSNVGVASLEAYITNLLNSNATFFINSSNLHVDPCPAFFDSNISSYEGSVLINNHLHVGGEICACNLRIANLEVQKMSSATGLLADFNGPVVFSCNVTAPSLTTQDVIVDNQIVFRASNDLGVLDNWWVQYLEVASNLEYVNLVFKSKRGTLVTFQDEFYPETLNFTGKHRCVMESRDVIGGRGVGRKKKRENVEDLTGMIVISSGKYKNLQGENKIDIDEAIPLVELCCKSQDKRAFGVVGGVEKDGQFRLGHISFKHDGISERVVVQNVGEGGIWVCNVNGNIYNGDYITTSDVPGLGMLQGDDIHKNYTVAKITCDCEFDMRSTIYECVEFAHKGKKYKKAFVGCVYACM